MTGGLILSRKSNPQYNQNIIYIENGDKVIAMRILESNHHEVRIGLNAPRNYKIFREENLTSEKLNELEKKINGNH